MDDELEAKKARKLATNRAYYHRNRERLRLQCKERMDANRERYRANQRKRMAEDDALRERRNAYVRQWRADNPERSKASNLIWKTRNRERWFAALRQRYSRIRQATPAWADRKAILDIYEDAKRRGPDFHVDHIVPLKSRWVCGLHTPDNLRITTRTENQRK